MLWWLNFQQKQTFKILSGQLQNEASNYSVYCMQNAQTFLKAFSTFSNSRTERLKNKQFSFEQQW